MCSMEWETSSNFLDDSLLELNGYGADFEKHEWSLFYFTHRREGCWTTHAIKAEDFFSLYSGERYTQLRVGREDCPGYCLDGKQLNRCEAFCKCAFNREIMQVIRGRQNNN